MKCNLDTRQVTFDHCVQESDAERSGAEGDRDYDGSFCLNSLKIIIVSKRACSENKYIFPSLGNSINYSNGYRAAGKTQFKCFIDIKHVQIDVVGINLIHTL